VIAGQKGEEHIIIGQIRKVGRGGQGTTNQKANQRSSYREQRTHWERVIGKTQEYKQFVTGNEEKKKKMRHTKKHLDLPRDREKKCV